MGEGTFQIQNLQRKKFEPKVEYPEGWGQTNNKPLREEYGYYLE